MIYVLTAWEDNGYHDSYFNESWWNTETQQVEFHEVGATAYAGGYKSNHKPIDDIEQLHNAMAWLAEHIYGKLRTAEDHDVMEPEPVNCAHGREMRLLRDCRHKGHVIPAGTVGEVVRHEAFGKFYRNGYNRPNRTNTRVTMRLADGSYQTVALSALRQHREPLTNAELRYRAAELSRDCQFSRASGWKFAWDSENYASDLLASSEKQVIAA